MTINRKRVGGLVALAATGLVSAAVAMPQAQAQETVSGFIPQVEQEAVKALTASGLTEQAALDKLAAQAGSTSLANKLIDRLGSKSADFFLNDAGKAVVNVLDPASAEQVRAAGATPKLVEHSAAELQSVKAKFDSIDSVPQTSWGIDPTTNKVVVTISDAAPQAQADKLASYAKSFGDTVRLERTAEKFSIKVAGGDAIQGGGSRCSAGFNGTQGGQDVVVTAGHCTAGVAEWDIGPSIGSDFPGTDYGLVQNNSGSAPAEVNLYDGSAQPIDGPAEAAVGQEVCKSGSTTQVTCGTVSALDATVDYGPDGVVEGTIETNVHSEPGDSGGALFAGAGALGMTSGGNSATTYFQPVGPALQAYGVTLK